MGQIIWKNGDRRLEYFGGKLYEYDRNSDPSPRLSGDPVWLIKGEKYICGLPSLTQWVRDEAAVHPPETELSIFKRIHSGGLAERLCELADWMECNLPRETSLRERELQQKFGLSIQQSEIIAAHERGLPWGAIAQNLGIKYQSLISARNAAMAKIDREKRGELRDVDRVRAKGAGRFRRGS